MRKEVKKQIPFLGTMLISLAICSLIFTLGAVAGSYTSAKLSDEAEVVVNTATREIFGYINDNGILASPSLYSIEISLVCACIMFASSLSVLGFVVAPLMLAAKGFAISYSCGAFISVMGKDALTLFCVNNLCDLLICLPILLFTAVQAIRYSLRLASSAVKGTGRRAYDLAFMKNSAFCAVAMLVSAIIQYTLIPRLAELTATIV